MALLKRAIDALAQAVVDEIAPSRTAAPDASAPFAKESLARAIDWVKFADAKAGTVLVIVGLLLTNALGKADVLLRAYSSDPAQGDWATATFVGSLLAASLTVAFVTLVLYPHVKAKTKSIAFFGDTAALSHKEYLKQISQLDSAASTEEVSKQAWEVSRIAAQKFRWLRWAYGSALAFLVLYSLSRILLVWKGGI